MQTIKSKLDASVNFVEEKLEGFIEARYVRRKDDYFVCYLSSHDGCNRGCRFCHLTATGQTNFVDVDVQGFLDQAKNVFEHYHKEARPAKNVHYNFMARGEVLANKYILSEADHVLWQLGEFAVKNGVTPKFCLSTIMPKTFNKNLSDVFRIITPTIYYSMYSVKDSFRKAWLPAAMPVNDALSMLKDYQSTSKKIVKIHYAFINGENDTASDVVDVCDAIDKHGLVCEFNLVRYNPFSAEQGQESPEDVLQRNFEYIKDRMNGRAKIITRVGEDAHASCGMFYDE